MHTFRKKQLISGNKSTNVSAPTLSILLLTCAILFLPSITSCSQTKLKVRLNSGLGETQKQELIGSKVFLARRDPVKFLAPPENSMVVDLYLPKASNRTTVRSLHKIFKQNAFSNIEVGAKRSFYLELGTAYMSQFDLEFSERHSIKDPASGMTTNLADKLKEAFNIDVFVGLIENKEVTEEFLATLSGYRFLVDFYTDGWGYAKYKNSHDYFGVFYISEAVVVNIEDQLPIGHWHCVESTDREHFVLSYDEIEKNIEKLQEELINLADLCVEETFSKLFGKI